MGFYSALFPLKPLGWEDAPIPGGGREFLVSVFLECKLWPSTGSGRCKFPVASVPEKDAYTSGPVNGFACFPQHFLHGFKGSLDL